MGLAANLMLAGRSSESAPFAERAIEYARAIDAPAIEARALNVLGVHRAALGDIAGGIELLRQSVAIATASGDPTEIPRSHANLGTLLEQAASPRRRTANRLPAWPPSVTSAPNSALASSWPSTPPPC